MKSSAKRPKLPPPADPPPSPTPTGADAVNARDEEMRLSKKRRGKASTILTAGQDLGVLNVEKKSMLG